MVVGTWMAYSTGTIKPVYALAIGGSTYSVYIGILAGALNIVVTTVLSFVLRAMGAAEAKDQTVAADYELHKSA
jgi:SSS family solute:Na+ symporter